MSNKALTYVWNNSKQTGSARVLMLAIADMANDDGECYPGTAKLAEKVLCSDRNLQKLVDKCETDGELMVIENGGTKTKHGWTNRYIITGLSTKTAQEVNARTPLKKSTGVKSDTPRGEQPDTPRGVNGDTQNPKDNPKDNPKNPAPKRNAFYDAVFEALEISASRNGGMQKMLQGIATDKTHKHYNLTEPITPDELIDWRDWYRECNGYPAADFKMVKSPEKVQSSITTWQELGKPKAKKSTRIVIEPVPEPAAPYEQYTPSETDEAIDFDALINDITEAKRVR